MSCPGGPHLLIRCVVPKCGGEKEEDSVPYSSVHGGGILIGHVSVDISHSNILHQPQYHLQADATHVLKLSDRFAHAPAHVATVLTLINTTATVSTLISNYTLRPS